MSRNWNRLLIGVVLLVIAAHTAEAAVVSKPGFNQAHGFYSSSFSVKITSATSGATIRYTTNGRAPTTTYGTQVANGSSVSISKTTCLRAMAWKSGDTASTSFTATYIFLNQVLTQSRPSGYPSTWRCADQYTGSDYAMDSVVVNDSAYSGMIVDAFKAIPTLSIAVRMEDMFHPTDGSLGVYTQGGGQGGQNTLERGVSAELIYSDGRPGFQINAGIKGHSHLTPKRSLRLLFKSNYGGTQTLNYPFFESAPLHSSGGTTTFGKIILRAGMNRGYTGYMPENQRKTTFCRDQWMRDSQISMSGYGGRGMFVHLYINGMYWGMYNAVERTDARWAKMYLGGGAGSKGDWFCANMGNDTATVVSGNSARWNTLLSLCKSNPAPYDTVKSYLRVGYFCDYVLLYFLAGGGDWQDKYGWNNFYFVNRNLPTTDGGRFMVWDGESSWFDSAPAPMSYPYRSNDGAWIKPHFLTSAEGSPQAFDPAKHKHIAQPFRNLFRNKDFRILFADRVYKHIKNGGALTDSTCKSRWSTLCSKVKNPVVCESARWGDGHWIKKNPCPLGTTRFTRNAYWYSARDAVLAMMDGNADRLITKCRAQSMNGYVMLPSINPPSWSQYGGTVASGYVLKLSSATGTTIYYRTDGQDPRVAGGGVLSGSSSGTSPRNITINSTQTVKARVKRNSTWSAIGNATFTVSGGSPPPTPSNLSPTVLGSTSIKLTWSDVSGETQYKIRRSLDGSDWNNPLPVFPTANVTVYTNTGLNPGTKYWFMIRSENAYGVSDYSTPVSATTDTDVALPAQPSGLAATAISGSDIQLTWNDNSDNEDNFKIRRSLDGVDFYVLDALFPSANTTTITDSGLNPSTTYYYKMRSENAAGQSAYTDPPASDTTLGDIPATPTAFSATAVSETQINLAWTDNASNEDYYKAYRSPDGVTGWARIDPDGGLPANTESFSDTNCAPDITYYYHVRCYNDPAGNSEYSNTDNATTHGGACAMPSDLAAEAQSKTSILLTWADNSNNEEGFRIRKSLDGVDFDTLTPLLPAANTSSATDTGLTAGTTYYYKIKALNSSLGDSDYTAVVNDATPAHITSFTAYNDLAWAVGQTNNKITTYTTTNGVTADNSGFLVDYPSNSKLDIVLTVTGGNGMAPTQGAHPATGTDAYAVFTNRVDCAGLISYGDSAVGTWHLVLAFSDLDPAVHYELAIYADRNNPAYTRQHHGTLEGADSFENASSPGATILTENVANDTTLYVSGYNNVNGYVSRFTAINPGSDGAFTLTLHQVEGSDYYSYANALMLRTTGEGPPPAPSELAAQAASSTSIQVTWLDNSDNEENFKLLRSLDGVVWTNLPEALPPANTSSYADSGLDPGTTYYYRIKAEHSTLGDSTYAGPVNATTPSGVGGFTAYNDLAWFAGQTTTRITTYTTTNNFASGDNQGWLVDYATGDPLDVMLTVTGANLPQEAQGAQPSPSTDADTVFGGKVDCSSVITYSGVNPQNLVLAFSGLNPASTYEAVVYSDRDEPSYSRNHHATIEGADSYANNSTAGATVTTVNTANDTTIYNAGYNVVNGYVSRFTAIDPGGDGAFTITLRQDIGATYYPYANALMLRTDSTPTNGLTEKVAKGASWRYARGNTEPSAPPTVWRGVSFDDSSWEFGPTPLGYKNTTGGLATSLGDMYQGYPTVYMRRTFTVPNPAVVNEMTVQVDYDDGFILFLNGQEMARVNVAGTPGTFMAHTNLAIASGSVAVWTNTWNKADMPVLLPGQNVVALQVFNGLLDSSDLHMDLALAAAEGSYLDPADDPDADGMSDAWEAARCEGGDGIATNDADGDGVNNGGEFVAGTHPTNPASVFSLDQTQTGDDLIISFDALPTTGTGYDGLGLLRYYALEECLDLEGGAWTIVPGYNNLPGNGSPVNYTNPAGPNVKHYRARVWLE